MASPGDTADERATVRDAINDWNIQRGRREKVALLPWLYERHAVPGMGDRPQAIINGQAVDQSDVVVAFFDSRIGTATGVDVSGTAEEIQRAVDLGKPVHVYFSTEAIPRDADREQLSALDDFKESLRNKGLLGDYSDPSGLAGQVIRALEMDISDRGWASAPAPIPQASGAVLRWHHDHRTEQRGIDKSGKMKHRVIANRLVVRNDGSSAATDMTFTVTPVDGSMFHFEAPDSPITVERDSELGWSLIAMGSGSIQIDAEWLEGDEPKSQRWTVSLN
ncbi:hypothetical protein AS181_22085 [Gordonia sp. SGD-V-85]|nr:hypothetical protein AS181_22085 [Gordonia sp. SGD-V-85]